MSLRGMTLVAALAWLLAGSPAAPAQGVDELIARTPAPTAREQQEVSRRLMALGAPGVKVLCQRLRDPLEAGDVKARLALHHVATYVARPGAPEAERKAFAAGAGEALRLVELNVHAKAFIVQQLQLAGGPDAVPVLAGLLSDERLCAPAAQALVAIGVASPDAGEPARAALRSAFPASAGARRTAVVKALAELKDDRLVEPIAAEVESRDLALRRVAVYYLANSGMPAAANPVEKAALAEDRYERSHATMLYLVLARRLTEKGHAEVAARICRELYRNRPEETQVRCAALAQLAATAGESAAEELFAALDERAADVRAAARALLVKLPGASVTRRWVERISSRELSPERRADAVLALGERGDRAGATPALAAAAKDADASVRSAAITALGTLGGAPAIGELLAVLEKGAAEGDRTAARDALAKARGDEVESTIAARYPAAPPALKAQLLRVLAARSAEGIGDRAAFEVESPAEEVRIAAYEALVVHGGGEVLPSLVLKLTTAAGDGERAAAERALGAIAARSPDRQGAAQVILASMTGVGPAVRAALIRVLGKVGGEQALAAVCEATTDADPAIREAAVRSLSDWPTAAGSADALLAVARARAEDDPKLHALAVRGALRQAERLRGDPAAAAALLAKVLDAARRPEERKQALAQLGGVEHVDALKLAASLAADPALGAEASAAALRLAEALKDRARDEAGAALTKVRDGAGDAATKRKAAELLESIIRKPR